jgi:tetratricopeptide (TPR) repeat protein
MNAQTIPAAAAPTVDDRNPWLGLASFTEETREYFYGRDEEVAELARRVQRKLLTVLFGQSGLGKTSILRAGLVPRLRSQGYCPVYVRVDYSRESPEPAEQIKQAIAQSARRSGEWTQAGIATQGESLWEYLHHRDDVLRNESGETLIPLLIFDQFEEIFTLAQTDEFGRSRAARFIADLADLVENRPPVSLEAKLEEDDATAERFDFARSDYRVLIALREDYLAPLEGLKTAMPSITQNRLRLAPMTGTQGMTAVMRPGKGLVSEEVAAAIVRFVAGGAELANAEVEPALLSLICRELNDARVAQGRAEISLDLLAGSHATILSNFYERVLSDQPQSVRRIIEDELLTDSGFRENVAEERLKRSFVAAGAPPETLATLVNRRLLRIEERLDVRRAELTHDVLCGVVKASRDQRKEREAREAAERSLLEQRQREQSARQALVRARKIASVCILLAIAAIGAAVFAYSTSQRAQRAEAQAQQTREQAEQLLGYLTTDFVPQLSSFGQTPIVASFTQREIDYFRGLPPELRGPGSIRSGALALAYHAVAVASMGDRATAEAHSAEAVALMEKMRAAGDSSEATTLALARAYNARADVVSRRQDPSALAYDFKAADLLRPLTEGANASRATRQLYMDTLGSIGYLQFMKNDVKKAEPPLREALVSAASLGGKDATDLEMSGKYVMASAWLVNTLWALGNSDEGVKIGADGLRAANLALERRPGHRQVLRGKGILENGLAAIASEALNPTDALKYNEAAEATSMTMFNIDPTNTSSVNNLGASYAQTGDNLWSLGRLQEGIARRATANESFLKATSAGEFTTLNYLGGVVQTANAQSDIGDYAGAVRTAVVDVSLTQNLRAMEPQGGFLTTASALLPKIVAAKTAGAKGDFESSYRIGTTVLGELSSVKAKEGGQQVNKDGWLFHTGLWTASAAYQTGKFAEAEKFARAALTLRQGLGEIVDSDSREIAPIATWLGMSLAQQHKTDEAAQVIAPYIKVERRLAAKNHGDVWVPIELAGLLYVQALTDAKQHDSLLKEATALIDSTPTTVRSLVETQRWRNRIQQAK